VVKVFYRPNSISVIKLTPSEQIYIAVVGMKKKIKMKFIKKVKSAEISD